MLPQSVLIEVVVRDDVGVERITAPDELEHHLRREVRCETPAG
jgi:hypothetical protein